MIYYANIFDTYTNLFTLVQVSICKNTIISSLSSIIIIIIDIIGKLDIILAPQFQFIYRQIYVFGIGKYLFTVYALDIITHVRRIVTWKMINFLLHKKKKNQRNKERIYFFLISYVYEYRHVISCSIKFVDLSRWSY